MQKAATYTGLINNPLSLKRHTT